MSVEGKFLSKEINDLFWREGLTLVTAELHGRKCGSAITAVAGKFTLLQKVELSPIPTK